MKDSKTVTIMVKIKLNNYNKLNVKLVRGYDQLINK